MENGEGFFGERVAARYDEVSSDMFDTAVTGPAVDLLARLAGDGAVLEFAVGTGRIAVPLAERGVRVVGIDNSDAMLQRLREKTQDVEALVGDMATTRVDGEFTLVFLVFNTIFNLTTQDEQVACFANAAAHLGAGGRFVIETRVPELQKLPLGQTIVNARSEPNRISNYVYDVVTQALQAQHYFIRDDGTVESSPVPMRYAWPAELDLMARLAGMRLEYRWGGWLGEPFTARSSSHVSVYVKT
jgi:SAM-dependent methyltransferase